MQEKNFWLLPFHSETQKCVKTNPLIQDNVTKATSQLKNPPKLFRGILKKQIVIVTNCCVTHRTTWMCVVVLVTLHSVSGNSWTNL